jgi:hypothetical protein
MKDGNSKDLYELKIVGAPDKLDKLKSVAESVALTVSFR